MDNELDQAIQSLRSVLILEKSICDEMIASARAQQDAIIRRDTDALMEIVSRQYEILLRMQEAGEDHLARAEELRDRLGANCDPASFTELIGWLPEDKVQPLKIAGAELAEGLKRQFQQNKINEELLQFSIQSVHSLLSLFNLNAPTTDPRYPGAATSERTAQPLLVDQRG
jgi:hypothetical protein